MEKRFQRDEQHKMIAGVCAGLAEYLNVDVTLVRVVFVLAMILHGAGLVPYIVLWIVMPKKVYGFNGNPVNNNPFNNTNPFNNPNPYNNAGPVDYTVPPQAGQPVDYSVPNPNPYGSFTPPQVPFSPQPKKASTAGVIVGVALVAFGSFFLLDNFDLLPDWEFDRLWPIIFVVMGAVLIFSRRKKQPWEQDNWHQPEEPVAAEEKMEEETGEVPPVV